MALSFPIRKTCFGHTRSWEQAEIKAKRLEGAPLSIPGPGKTIRQAVKLYIEDKHEQSLSTGWEYKLTRETNDLAEWSEKQGFLTLPELTLERLEQYRKSWNGAAITRSKRQERLRSFFLYCRKHRWVEENVAADLSKIKVMQSPTLPLSEEQFAAVMERAAVYNPKGADSQWRRQRAISMLLLLRWSGLRLSDAARLERSKLNKDGKIMLYMQKTGEGVYVALPPHAVTALRKLKYANPKYFFWNGTSSIEGPVKRWWSTLNKIFTAAGIKAHPHMLRDTFAVERLLAGVSLEEVSMLLGHGDIAITKKHYSPWVRARQLQLDESVKKSWPQQE